MSDRIEFICNDQNIKAAANGGMSLLDYLRNHLLLKGTKEGCREGDCGACTVLIGELNKNIVKYRTINSCLMPLGSVKGKHVVTIEGLNIDEGLTRVQQAFVNEGASQCGFCTPGFIISLTGYYLNNLHPEIQHAINSLDGNICRCTGYASIKRAAADITGSIENSEEYNKHIRKLIGMKIIPGYFFDIPEKLKLLQIDHEENILYGREIVSGGTDLMVHGWEEILDSEINLLDKNIGDAPVTVVNNSIKILGTATVTDLMESKIIKELLPSVAKSLELFGSMPIRNRATVAGNIVNASPIADLANILLAFNSLLHLRIGNDFRKVYLNKFYHGYKDLDLNPGEVLEFITFPVPAKSSLFNFEKISRRTYLDIASVNSSVLLEMSEGYIMKNVTISAGGVAPFPLVLRETGECLLGKKINVELLNEASGIAMKEISPISDARGSADYKSLLLHNLILAHFITLTPELINEGELI